MRKGRRVLGNPPSSQSWLHSSMSLGRNTMSAKECGGGDPSPPRRQQMEKEEIAKSGITFKIPVTYF